MERKISKVFNLSLHRPFVKGDESTIKEKRDKKKRNVEVSKRKRSILSCYCLLAL